MDARETLQTQSTARAAEEAWAGEDGVPEVLSTTAFAFTASTEGDDERMVPRSYWEAMKRPDLWIPAMEAELDIMREKDMWDVVRIEDVPTGKKVVDCMWVYANKFNAEGEIVKRKACLVAKGYTQVQGEDFDETYASVVCLESMRMSVAIAASLGLELWQIDFVSAYLNSDLEHTMYMRPLPGLQNAGGKVLHLRKTIYGLMQGGCNWWHVLNKVYDALGYLASRADGCVCYKQIGPKHTITNNYNDDVLGVFINQGGS